MAVGSRASRAWPRTKNGLGSCDIWHGRHGCLPHHEHLLCSHQLRNDLLSIIFFDIKANRILLHHETNDKLITLHMSYYFRGRYLLWLYKHRPPVLRLFDTIVHNIARHSTEFWCGSQVFLRPFSDLFIQEEENLRRFKREHSLHIGGTAWF